MTTLTAPATLTSTGTATAAPHAPLLAGLADLLARARRAGSVAAPSGWLATGPADRDGERLLADLRAAAGRSA